MHFQNFCSSLSFLGAWCLVHIDSCISARNEHTTQLRIHEEEPEENKIVTLGVFRWANKHMILTCAVTLGLDTAHSNMVPILYSFIEMHRCVSIGNLFFFFFRKTQINE